MAPGFSTQFCDVEVDPETGKVTILRFVAAQDVGCAIHPSYVEGQIQGGVAQGIGWALNEEYIDDRNGRHRQPCNCHSCIVLLRYRSLLAGARLSKELAMPDLDLIKQAEQAGAEPAQPVCQGALRGLIGVRWVKRYGGPAPNEPEHRERQGKWPRGFYSPPGSAAATPRACANGDTKSSLTY